MKPREIDYRSAFQLRRRWLGRSTIAVVVLAVGSAFIAAALHSRNHAAFEPGPVSVAHVLAVNGRGESIEHDCRACHEPWRGVTDQRCQSCHGQKKHSGAIASSCATCHAEHRGAASLVSIPDSRCTACHGAITFPRKHPQFRFPPDRDALRFDHALHLQAEGVPNAQGEMEVLSCSSCHRLVETGGKLDPAPIRFEADCRRCHRLTFDPSLPDAEVPHGGDPSSVYGYVLAAESRRRPVESAEPRATRMAKEVIADECSTCHDVQPSKGLLTIAAPSIRSHWMNGVAFSHASHTELPCDACHAAARRSRETADVLLPSRGVCAECHAAVAGSSRASNDCVLCHRYHDHVTALMQRTASVRDPS